VVDDIENRLWQKLLVNAGINGLTVLYDCPNGQLLEIPEASSRLRTLVEEGARIARHKGIDVGPDPVARTLEVCRDTASNISSMLQDVRLGRPTEIMAINGALLAEAKKWAIPAPENALLVSQILALEKKPSTY
jgi:2-dehydropantoate 2-reductase